MQAHTQEGDNSKTSGPHLEVNDNRTVCNLTTQNLPHNSTASVAFVHVCDTNLCSFSLQRVLGLKTLEGVLDPTHVKSKHIVHNVFSVNKMGIVVLENKAGIMH